MRDSEAQIFGADITPSQATIIMYTVEAVLCRYGQYTCPGIGVFDDPGSINTNG